MTQQSGSQFEEDLTVGIDEDESFATDSIDLLGIGGDESSPIARLKTIILSIDWEINDDILQQLDDELHDLGEIWAGDKIKQVYVQGLSKIGRYIYKEKAGAHPNSIKLLITFYHNLEKIVTKEESMSEDEKKQLLLADVKKFDQLKSQIGKPSPQSPSQEPAIAASKKVTVVSDYTEESDGSSELKTLKALVLGIDWEINDREMQHLGTEVKRLEGVFSQNKAKLILLQGIGALSSYINKKRSQSNSSVFSLLHSFYSSLEKINTTELSSTEEKQLLLSEVSKFNDFKTEIAKDTSSPASVVSDAGTEIDHGEDTGTPVAIMSDSPASFSDEETTHEPEFGEEDAAVEEDVNSRLSSVFGDEGEDAEEGSFSDSDANDALAGVNVETDADDDSDEEALPYEDGAIAPALADVDEDSSFSVEKLADDLSVAPPTVQTEAIVGDDIEEEDDFSLEDVGEPEAEAPSVAVGSEDILQGVEVETEADDDTGEESLPMEAGELAPALSDADDNSGFNADNVAAEFDKSDSDAIESRLGSFFDDEVATSSEGWVTETSEQSSDAYAKDTAVEETVVAALGDTDEDNVIAALSDEDEDNVIAALSDEDEDNVIAALSDEDEDNVIAALSDEDEDNVVAALSDEDEDNVIAALSDEDEDNVVAALSDENEDNVVAALSDEDEDNVVAALSDEDEDNVVAAFSDGDENNVVAALSDADEDNDVATLSDEDEDNFIAGLSDTDEADEGDNLENVEAEESLIHEDFNVEDEPVQEDDEPSSALFESEEPLLDEEGDDALAIEESDEAAIENGLSFLDDDIDDERDEKTTEILYEETETENIVESSAFIEEDTETGFSAPAEESSLDSFDEGADAQEEASDILTEPVAEEKLLTVEEEALAFFDDDDTEIEETVEEVTFTDNDEIAFEVESDDIADDDEIEFTVPGDDLASATEEAIETDSDDEEIKFAIPGDTVAPIAAVLAASADPVAVEESALVEEEEVVFEAVADDVELDLLPGEEYDDSLTADEDIVEFIPVEEDTADTDRYESLAILVAAVQGNVENDLIQDIFTEVNRLRSDKNTSFSDKTFLQLLSTVSQYIVLNSDDSHALGLMQDIVSGLEMSASCESSTDAVQEKLFTCTSQILLLKANEKSVQAPESEEVTSSVEEVPVVAVEEDGERTDTRSYKAMGEDEQLASFVQKELSDIRKLFVEEIGNLRKELSEKK